MKLYYMPGACSLAARIVLEWTGTPYEAVRVPRENLKTPEYMALNPTGSVPTLTHGDLVLTQNASILEYLAEQSPDSGLAGDGSPASRAEVRRWLGFLNSDVHKTFSLLFAAPRYVKDEAAQADLRASAAAMLDNYLGIIDQRLADQPYVTGPTRSIADAYLYVVLRWAKAKEVGQGHARLADFMTRMQADPKVQAALQAEGQE